MEQNCQIGNDLRAVEKRFGTFCRIFRPCGPRLFAVVIFVSKVHQRENGVHGVSEFAMLDAFSDLRVCLVYLFFDLRIEFSFRNDIFIIFINEGKRTVYEVSVCADKLAVMEGYEVRP